MRHAKAEDVTRLARSIKDNWTLCEFLGKCEAEYMVAETIHAAAKNMTEHGEPFSFRGGGIDNNAGYSLLLRRELIVEGKRLGRPVIFPTQKLIDELDRFLAKATPCVP